MPSREEGNQNLQYLKAETLLACTQSADVDPISILRRKTEIKGGLKALEEKEPLITNYQVTRG